jgi:signal transduction histidine kinase
MIDGVAASTGAERRPGFLPLHTGPLPTLWTADDGRPPRRDDPPAEAATVQLEAAHRLAFLDEASRRLASSLDYDATLAHMARSPLPLLADACVVHLLDDDGALRPAADAQAAPLQQRWLDALRRPAQPSASPVIARILETGQAALVADPRALWPTPDDAADGLASLPWPSGRSVMLAPLLANARALGMLTLVTTDGRRHSADLALAEALAHRAALALANALHYREAQAAIRLRQDLLATASHQLKTPLTTIAGYVDLLRGQLGRPDLDRERLVLYAEELQHEVGALHALLNSLLDVSRTQNGRLELHLQSVELVELTRQVLAGLAQSPLCTPRHRLVLEAPTAAAGLYDRARLEQALINLVTNALKFSPDGGEVRVSVHSADGQVGLTVADQGIGIPAAELADLVQPFARSPTVARRVSGLGLGLYIAAQIIELHGGTIALTSQPGVGSVVSIALPLAPPDGGRLQPPTGVPDGPRPRFGQVAPGAPAS